jgi:hypothetical protein
MHAPVSTTTTMSIANRVVVAIHKRAVAIEIFTESQDTDVVGTRMVQVIHSQNEWAGNMVPVIRAIPAPIAVYVCGVVNDHVMFRIVAPVRCRVTLQ